MPLQVPMIPVDLRIVFKGSEIIEQYFTTKQVDEIPLPECEIDLSIGGHRYLFTQTRRWDGSKMHVRLTPHCSVNVLELHNDLAECHCQWIRG